jgi:hypothetical protein
VCVCLGGWHVNCMGEAREEIPEEVGCLGHTGPLELTQGPPASPF